MVTPPDVLELCCTVPEGKVLPWLLLVTPVVTTLMVILSAEIDEELAKVRTSWSTELMEVSAGATVTPLAGLGLLVVVVVVVAGMVVVVVVGAVVVVVVGAVMVVVTDTPALAHGLAG